MDDIYFSGPSSHVDGRPVCPGSEPLARHPSLEPKGTGQTRWVTRWKPALNAFAITFADRIPAAEDS
jgi:hypothetical protein